MAGYHKKAALFEHRFWLQILGDHARFILDTLSSKEKGEIEFAKHYVHVFDQYLGKIRHEVSTEELSDLAKKVYVQVLEMKTFKLHLIQRHLVGEIAIGLSPSFINHMVNELEEYERILHSMITEKCIPVYHPVHHHILWLQDAFGHSASIAAFLDMSEKQLQEKSRTFTKHFEAFYLKAVELAGYLRTNLPQFPALSRFNHQVELEMHMFKAFLHEIEEWELRDEILGILSPLMADHMAREECYYLTKLAEVTEVKKPDCDPTHPRRGEPKK